MIWAPPVPAKKSCLVSGSHGLGQCLGSAPSLQLEGKEGPWLPSHWHSLVRGQASLTLLSFQNPLLSLLRLSPLGKDPPSCGSELCGSQGGELGLHLFFSPLRTKALVLELLAAVCLVRGGHEIILAAFDNFKEVSLLHLWGVCACVSVCVFGEEVGSQVGRQVPFPVILTHPSDDFNISCLTKSPALSAFFFLKKTPKPPEWPAKEALS